MQMRRTILIISFNTFQTTNAFKHNIIAKRNKLSLSHCYQMLNERRIKKPHINKNEENEHEQSHHTM